MRLRKRSGKDGSAHFGRTGRLTCEGRAGQLSCGGLGSLVSLVVEDWVASWGEAGLVCLGGQEDCDIEQLSWESELRI